MLLFNVRNFNFFLSIGLDFGSYFIKLIYILGYISLLRHVACIASKLSEIFVP